MAQAQVDLDQKVVELAAQVAADPAAETEMAMAQELLEVRAGLAAMVDATAQPLQAALDDLRSEIASLQQRVDVESAARSEVAQIGAANRQLAQAHGDLDQRVVELVGQVAGHPGG